MKINLFPALRVKLKFPFDPFFLEENSMRFIKSRPKLDEFIKNIDEFFKISAKSLRVFIKDIHLIHWMPFFCYWLPHAQELNMAASREKWEFFPWIFTSVQEFVKILGKNFICMSNSICSVVI